MAAPHAIAAVALIASEHPSLRHRPGALVARLKATARPVRNVTPPLSATDTSPGDLTGDPCPTGHCHLGGAPISDRNAYGAGLARVANPRAVAGGRHAVAGPLAQSAPDWLWRTRSTMLSRARGEKGLVK
jgi:hypothetical protein